MKNRIGLIILSVVALALAVALFATKKRADEEKARDTDTIVTFSNRLVVTSTDLDEQRQVNVMLTNDLSSRNTQILTLTNKLLETADALSKAEDTLKVNLEEMAKRDARISDLEAQNQELDKKALELSNTITNLNGQIAETQHKLDSAEGDKEFLSKELQRLMAEKAEMERRFNDLEVMRAQVRKLREELSIARRLDWLRRGVAGDQKAGERMVQQTASGQGTNNAPRYDLNVEVDADGTVRLLPPTNAPSASSPSTPAP